MVTGRDIDTLLEMFGNDHFETLGFYCKRKECLECEFFFSCHRKPPLKKLPIQFDYVISNLEHGFPLTREEFHAELKREKKERKNEICN